MIFFPSDTSGPYERLALPPAFDVSWAGPNPLEPGICLGSIDGGLAFCGIDGHPHDGLVQASANSEAVNGVAWSHDWIMVTTRAEINLIGPWKNRRLMDAQALVIDFGSLGVAVAPSGRFVVPLGPKGLMFIKPPLGPGDPDFSVLSGRIDDNVYSVLAMSDSNGSDLIVFAARRNGIGATTFNSSRLDGNKLRMARYTNLDWVDVCSIATPEHPRAVAAVTKDGVIAFYDDILTDIHPVTVKFRSLGGTVYRLLSHNGTLYILTSLGLRVIMDVANGFLDSRTVHRTMLDILAIEVDAIDANFVENRWLVAAGDNCVHKIDVTRLPQKDQSHDESHLFDILPITPTWEESDSPTTRVKVRTG